MQYGRFLRGIEDKDFETLSDNPDRKVVFFISDEELREIEDLSDYEKLKHIGYPDEDIKHYIEKGVKFKLVTFPVNEQTKELAKSATWENVIEMACEAYPELSQKLKDKLDLLKNYSFEKLEEEAKKYYNDEKYEFGKIPREDKRYMSPENFANSAGSLVECRAFLYHTLNLNRLFAGDGYTRIEKEDGELSKGAEEIVGLNTEIKNIPGHIIKDLSVHIPSERDWELRVHKK